MRPSGSNASETAGSVGGRTKGAGAAPDVRVRGSRVVALEGVRREGRRKAGKVPAGRGRAAHLRTEVDNGLDSFHGHNAR